MNTKLRVIRTLFIMNSVCFSAYSQYVSDLDISLGSIASTNKTPFWLRSNQYGTVPLGVSSAATASVGLYGEYSRKDSVKRQTNWAWGYGVNVVANTTNSVPNSSAFGSTNFLVVPELYTRIKYKSLEMYVGRRREIFGLVDTLLSSGAYSWSGNALPIPKVQIYFSDYTPVPYTKGVVSIIGGIAHGWLEYENKDVRGSYLHQTYLYGKIGKPSWRVHFYGGVNHQVVWAGRTNILSPSVPADGQLPSSFRAFANVFLGIRGDLDDPAFKTQNNFEGNRIGNHLGSVDLGTDFDINRWNVFMYRQFPYDDGSLFYGTNLKDGLNGIRIRNNVAQKRKVTIHQITAEYLFTGSQGGDEFVLDDPKRRGRDNYFNNSQFSDGWTYFGRTIGSPFLTYYNDVNSLSKLEKTIANNRVSVYHVGINAILFYVLNVSAKLSYSINAGTYNEPFLKLPRQFSGIVTASAPVNILGGILVNGSLAVDVGGLLPNSVGGLISLRKTGLLSGKKTDYERATPFRMP